MISFTVSLAKVGQYFNKYYSTANSLALMGSSTGVMICAPLAQFLILEYGYQGALFIFSGICANIIACGAVMKDPCRKQSWQNTNVNDSDVKDGNSGQKDRTVNSKTALIEKKEEKDKLGFFLVRHLILFTLCAENFTAYFGWSGFVIYVVPHAEQKGLLTYNATWLATTGGLGNVLGKLAMPTLMDRKVISPTTVLFLGQLMSGMALIVDPIVTNFTLLTILSGCFGFGFGTASLAVFVLVKDFSGAENLSRALPWLTLAGGLARLLAGFLIGEYGNLMYFHVHILKHFIII